MFVFFVRVDEAEVHVARQMCLFERFHSASNTPRAHTSYVTFVPLTLKNPRKNAFLLRTLVGSFVFNRCVGIELVTCVGARGGKGPLRREDFFARWKFRTCRIKEEEAYTFPLHGRKRQRQISACVWFTSFSALS